MNVPPLTPLPCARLPEETGRPAFPDLFRDDVFTLETERLFLRWPKASDEAALLREAGDRRVAEPHATIPHPYGREHAIRFVAEARGINTEGKGCTLAIAPRGEPGRLIGVVSLRQRANGDISLGYWLGHAHWRQGLATEAVRAVLDAGFLYAGVPSVLAQVRVTNPASRAVLERCGFRHEGADMCLRPAWGDSVPADTYRLARSLWKSLRGWRSPLPSRHVRGENA